MKRKPRVKKPAKEVVLKMAELPIDWNPADSGFYTEDQPPAEDKSEAEAFPARVAPAVFTAKPKTR